MSTAVPDFNHVKEYARYGGVMPRDLSKRVASFYPGTLEVIVVDDDTETFQTVSRYNKKLRGYLYHHGFHME
jgi:tRNA A37 threonylcarbamoyladenosine synthetase subunit TsaC/SUA5/YrdC